MQSESSYSPVLWAAILIPVIAGLELFVDPATRKGFDFFVLGFFYCLSVRYTLAVILGVYAHQTSLQNNRQTRSGAALWFCYLMVLVLCSLLVPGAAIFGLVATLFLATFVLLFSLLQGLLSRKSCEAKERNDVHWRIGFDALLLVIIAYESLVAGSMHFQSAFFAIVVFFIMDFTVSEFARGALVEMSTSLKEYLHQSWTEKV